MTAVGWYIGRPWNHEGVHEGVETDLEELMDAFDAQ